MQLKIPALPFKQRGTQMYLAAFPLNALSRCVVDCWKPHNIMGQRGYQRLPDENRVHKIAKFLESREAIMPVAGLLNVRQKGKIEYKDGFLTIKDNVDIWVVDMQHRMRGLIEARDNEVFDGQEFECPVVITEGLGMLHEAAQFYIINTKAKKMDVALTRRLLIENDEVGAVADVPDWELLAVKATIDLNSDVPGPWRGATDEEGYLSADGRRWERIVKETRKSGRQEPRWGDFLQKETKRTKDDGRGRGGTSRPWREIIPLKSKSGLSRSFHLR